MPVRRNNCAGPPLSRSHRDVAFPDFPRRMRQVAKEKTLDDLFYDTLADEDLKLAMAGSSRKASKAA